MSERYRNYTITYDPPPIPTRQFDWSYVHDDYDGAPNEPGGPPADDRCGFAASSEACRQEIDWLEEDVEVLLAEKEMEGRL